jgi:hypothetical protein
MKQKPGSLKKTKIDRSLANLTKMRREKTQISKIRNAKGEIATNTMEIQGIIRDCFENLYFNKFENLEEMGKFLDTYYDPKLNQDGINHLNRSITSNEIEAAIKSLQKKKSPGPEGFSAWLPLRRPSRSPPTSPPGHCLPALKATIPPGLCSAGPQAYVITPWQSARPPPW